MVSGAKKRVYIYNGSSDCVVHKKLSLYLYNRAKSSLRLDTF